MARGVKVCSSLVSKKSTEMLDWVKKADPVAKGAERTHVSSRD